MKVKLSKYLKPYALFAVLTPLSMVGEVLGDLLQPKLMSKIVDDGVLGHDMDLIIRTGLLMLLVLIGGGACGIAASAFGGIASQSFSRDLRVDVFKRVMGLSTDRQVHHRLIGNTSYSGYNRYPANGRLHAENVGA